MKIRVIFLRKKIIFSLILIILTTIAITTTIKHKNITTFNLLTPNKTIQKDLTGDGKEDTMNINNVDNKYSVTIKSKKNKFVLKNKDNENFLGMYNGYWPINVRFVDINRDKTPEIFIQCSQYNMPIQYIYHWQNNKFKNIHVSNNNILGFMDYNNNKTPKVICGNIVDDNICFDSFIFMEGKLQRFNYNFEEGFMGSNTILSFINYIKSLPEGEEHKPKDIFMPNIDNKDVAVIGNLVKDNNIYTFEDASFKDIKNNDKGDILEIKWSLNFKGTCKNNDKNIKNYNIDLLLMHNKKDETDPYKFKIYSISLN